MNRLRKYIFALTLAMLPMCGWGGLRLQQGNFATAQASVVHHS